MSQLVAAFPNETEMLDVLARLSAEEEVEFETYGPNWPADSSDQRSILSYLIPAAGICGAAFIYGLQCLATVSSWGYPVNIGGRPKFSWPAYIPTTVSWALFCAAIAAVGGFFLLGRMFKLWEPVDEADAIRGAMRDQWVLAVHSEEEEVIDRIRPLLFGVSKLPVDTVSAYTEEVPA